jgi:hypothetical protein
VKTWLEGTEIMRGSLINENIHAWEQVDRIVCGSKVKLLIFTAVLLDMKDLCWGLFAVKWSRTWLLYPLPAHCEFLTERLFCLLSKFWVFLLW